MVMNFLAFSLVCVDFVAARSSTAVKMGDGAVAWILIGSASEFVFRSLQKVGERRSTHPVFKGL